MKIACSNILRTLLCIGLFLGSGLLAHAQEHSADAAGCRQHQNE